MSNQIVFTLPDDVPTPKFTLFQKVRRTFDNAAPSDIGTVVGLEFVTFRVALHSNWSTMGWEYKIDWLHGTEERAALRVHEPCESFYAADLEAVEAL